MIGDYRIYCDMDAIDIMYCLSDSQEVDFVYDCYECLSALKKGDFIERIGVEDVIKLLDDEKVVEHLGDKALIEELKERGYDIIQYGWEDI